MQLAHSDPHIDLLAKSLFREKMMMSIIYGSYPNIKYWFIAELLCSLVGFIALTNWWYLSLGR